MENSLEKEWSDIIDVAKGHDDSRSRPYEEGLTAIAIEARSSDLRRHYPFTSLGKLCFSSGPRFWLGEGTPMPVYIAVQDGSLYQVWAYDPYVPIGDGMTPRLETYDPQEAVAEAVRVLAKG
jgi:hypothetical protein